ncbi:MAG: BspA family leucine-rich repeat surface protein, partial [Prevotella sp.]|nr:BspA family leucine-rich repeat surface protein [Prevotella sp.]
MNSENCFKKIYFLIYALVALSMNANAVRVPYAEYTESDNTLTFRYGEMPSSNTCFSITWNADEQQPWHSYYSSVKHVVFESSFSSARPEICYRWFYGMGQLQDITGLEYLNTSSVTDMSEMFCGCSGLTSLDVSGFNTSSVTDMSEMFSGCYGLTSLDVSGFNTSSVTDMSEMFRGCPGLTSLDVSGFNTSNVTNMACMFYVCKNLTNLDVREFKTSNVTVMNGMFSECIGLTSLDVSGFNTS